MRTLTGTLWNPPGQAAHRLRAQIHEGGALWALWMRLTAPFLCTPNSCTPSPFHAEFIFALCACRIFTKLRKERTPNSPGETANVPLFPKGCRASICGAGVRVLRHVSALEGTEQPFTEQPFAGRYPAAESEELEPLGLFLGLQPPRAARCGSGGGGDSAQVPATPVGGSLQPLRAPPPPARLPGRARGVKGAAPGSAEPRLLPVACPRLGVGVWWGWGRGRGKGRVRRRRQPPTCGREVGGCGAIEKEPTRSSPKLVWTPGSRVGQERNGGVCLSGRWERGPDGEHLSLLGLRAPRTEAGTGADSGGTQGLSRATGATPKARASACLEDPLAPGGLDRTPRPSRSPQATGDAPAQSQRRSPAALPLEGETLLQPDPSPGTDLAARRPRPEPPASSVHFLGEMSERKEGRAKGKGKKKDRNSGKKPAAGGPSPGECAVRPGLRDPLPPGSSLLLRLPARPALRAPGPGPGRPRSRAVLALRGAAPPLGACTPHARRREAASVRALRGSGTRCAPGHGLLPASTEPGSGSRSAGAEAGARASRAGRALHGPRLPSSGRHGNGSPLGVPGSEEGGSRERPPERLRVGVSGAGAGGAGSRWVRTVTLIQSRGAGTQLSWAAIPVGPRSR